MKKLLLILVLVIGGIGFGTQPAAAQKGEMALGLSGGYASHNDGGYANVYFHYTVAPHVRLAPEIGYIFRNKGVSGFEMSIDVDFPFKLARGFAVYPLVGPTLNSWSPVHGDSYTRFGVDFGAGFDIYLTRNLKLNLQGKYSLMNDCSGCFIGMGIAYVF